VIDINEISWIEQNISALWSLATGYYDQEGRGALLMNLAASEARPSYFRQDRPPLALDVLGLIASYDPKTQMIIGLLQPGKSFNVYIVSDKLNGPLIELKGTLLL
jgi:hypothetical protein